MYTAYYQLSEEPFRLTSDPRFFHLAEPHAAALSTVVEGVVRRKGFIVMTGQIGTGKTTVLHAALQILSERANAGSSIASAFILNPMLTRDEFFEMILSEFEIPCAATSKSARLAALQKMLLNVQHKGGTSVLIVDEAHLLSAELLEEIRLLSNTDTYREKLLQIILCGQSELLPMLRRPELEALQQRIAAHCSLRPLSFPEVRAYIAERLNAAGFRETSYPFPTSALEGVYRYSKGVPRLINLICDACLTIGCETQRFVIPPDIVEEVAIELGMHETQAARVAAEKAGILIPVNGRNLPVAGGDAVLMTTLDALILVMKQRLNPPRSNQ
jgi:general secretion pathway protein A